MPGDIKAIKKAYEKFVRNYLTDKGFLWNNAVQCFSKDIGDAEIRIFVSINRHSHDYVSTNFPIHICLKQVEELRSRFKKWPESLSPAQKQKAELASATAVQAYPKSLGADANVDIDDDATALQPETKADDICRIIDAQLAWAEQHHQASVLRDEFSLDNIQSAPAPLPNQRIETLALFLFIESDKSALGELKTKLKNIRGIDVRELTELIDRLLKEI